jgi:hypothetical protein
MEKVKEALLSAYNDLLAANKGGSHGRTIDLILEALDQLQGE